MSSAPTSAGNASRDALWVVQEGGSGAALAFVLAGYGDAWVATGLARSLGAAHTVYGLQPPRGMPPGQLPARELAALYVSRLLEKQPQGPYCLSGYSAGAVIALEIAQQLRASGASVRTVALLDPLFFRYTRFELRCYQLLQRVCRSIKPLLPERWRLMKILEAMFQDQGLDVHLAALDGYEPQPYDGELVLYQSHWTISRSPLLVSKWKRIATRGLKIDRKSVV